MKKLLHLGNACSGVILSKVALFMVTLIMFLTACSCNKDVTPPTPPSHEDNSTVPAAPAGVTATADNKFALVQISASPADGGKPITGYTVVSNPSDGVDSNASSTTLSHKITGLKNGTLYTFTAVAINAKGSSASSVASNAVIPASPRQKLLCDSLGWYVNDNLYWDGPNLIDQGPFTELGAKQRQSNFYLNLDFWWNIGANNPKYPGIDPNTFGRGTWKFTNADETTMVAGGVDYKIILLTATTLIIERTTNTTRDRSVMSHKMSP